MADFQEVMKQFHRMCKFYQSRRSCPKGCPMSGLNISQCRKQLVDAYVDAEYAVMAWAAEHPEHVYPTWFEWLKSVGALPAEQTICHRGLEQPIPADIAEKLGIEPKEDV